MAGGLNKQPRAVCPIKLHNIGKYYKGRDLPKKGRVWRRRIDNLGTRFNPLDNLKLGRGLSNGRRDGGGSVFQTSANIFKGRGLPKPGGMEEEDRQTIFSTENNSRQPNRAGFVETGW